MSITLETGSVTFDNDLPLIFIGGPCVIESRDHALSTAETIKKITDKLGIGFVYKSSYDKSNRTSVTGYRGPGIVQGLKILGEVQKELEVPVLSDVHSAAECVIAADLLDIIQIPAFLCRQTDLLLAAGRCGVPVNIKKGQFMAPWDMSNVIEKVINTAGNNVMLTERGSMFGYNNLIVDMTSIHEMKKLDVPVIFDAGHSVQRPGGLGHATGGNREEIPILARAAVSVGVAGVFLETHKDPDNAPCDGPNMWPTGELESLLTSLVGFDNLAKA